MKRRFRSLRDWGSCRREPDYKFPGYGPAMWWDIPAARSYATEEEELADLRSRVQMLHREMQMVLQRIAELEDDEDRTLDG
jgi:hypothetical protein